MPFDATAIKELVKKHPVAVFGIGGGVVLGLIMLMGKGKAKSAGNPTAGQLQPPSWWLGSSSGGSGGILPLPLPIPTPDPVIGKPPPTPGSGGGGIPMCPPGFNYDPVTRSCVLLGVPVPHLCLPGQVWDPREKRCIYPGPDPGPEPEPVPIQHHCPPWEVWDEGQGRCVRYGEKGCDAGYHWNGTTCVPDGGGEGPTGGSGGSGAGQGASTVPSLASLGPIYDASVIQSVQQGMRLN